MITMDMDYGRLGERQRNFQFPLLELGSAVLLMMAIVLGMFELVNYSNQKDELPTDLTVAQVAVGGLNEADAQARWERVYMDQPVQLIYDGSPIDLYPAEIGFRVDSEAMLADARGQISQERNFWIGFWNYLERRPVAAVSIPLKATYPDNLLREYLTDIAQRYDVAGGEATYDPVTLTFQSGQFGRRLDIESAIPMIERALFEPDAINRRVILPTLSAVSSTEQDMATLREGILSLVGSMGFLNREDRAVSVYIMDLETGEEVRILADVPHSMYSTVKIPIMINLFRHELLVPNGSEIAYLLTESILCSNNSSSNLLMQVVGDGYSTDDLLRDGLRQVSCTAQELGAAHTYISSPIDVGVDTPRIEADICRPKTPANNVVYTEPDVYSQTTAEDMGLLLAQIYDCANFDSGLRAIYPEDITQHECQQMLNLLSGVRIDRLIELGVPEGTRVAHKNGWGGVTAADAGIVYSAGRTYILSVYIYEHDSDNNGLTTLQAWEVIEEVSRLAYNYFNPLQPLVSRRAPISEWGAIECVTAASPELVNLDDIDQNRLGPNGDPLPTACYGGAGTCHPFDGWAN